MASPTHGKPDAWQARHSGAPCGRCFFCASEFWSKFIFCKFFFSPGQGAQRRSGRRCHRWSATGPSRVGRHRGLLLATGRDGHDHHAVKPDRVLQNALHDNGGRVPLPALTSCRGARRVPVADLFEFRHFNDIARPLRQRRRASRFARRRCFLLPPPASIVERGALASSPQERMRMAATR